MNFIAVLLAGIATMVIGFLWYSPTLLGKVWLREMNLSSHHVATAKAKGLGKQYFCSFLSSLVMIYVLQTVFTLLVVTAVAQAIHLSFLLWLGFVATVQLGNTLFGSQSFKLYLITTGYQLVSLVIAALVLFYV